MFHQSKNGIITLCRGDTFSIPLYINLGTAVNPNYYILQKHLDKQGEEIARDYVYFAVLEPNQKWEDAIIKKRMSYDDIDFNYDAPILHFYTDDTEYLKPGTYYYQVKLQRCPESTSDGFEHVDTVINRTKFIIYE